MMPGDLLYHTFITEDGSPRVGAGPLIEHGESLAVFFFNEINRARPQVQALLLRAMAERSVTAFNQTRRIPHLLVFADRNRVEKGETFELAAAARDRFMMEIAIEAPSADEDRARLIFDPELPRRRAAADALPGRTSSTTGTWRRSAAPSSATFRQAATLERYALDLMRATATPQRVRRAVAGRQRRRARGSGREPARHEPDAARGAGPRVPCGPRRIWCRRTCRRSSSPPWSIGYSSRRSTSSNARRSHRSSSTRCCVA